MQFNHLIVVSNRLPLALRQTGSGKWEIQRGSGGLVTAMEPVLQQQNGLWIGWPGAPDSEEVDRLIQEMSESMPYAFQPVTLSEDELRGYYYGFSNEILWPLFHDQPSRCNFEPWYWQVYQDVNRKFARVIEKSTTAEDYVWVQDYHLLLVAQELRRLGVRRRLGCFLHTPFPPLDIFLKLPWRNSLLEGILGYDLLGFQTIRDRRNFEQCVKALVPQARCSGRGRQRTVRLDSRELQIGVFPISIDSADFARRASSQEVAERAWYIHERLSEQRLVLGVDRLDYTKGIPERLRAFENALLRYPELRERLTFIQVVVPSRTDVPEYQNLKKEIERLVGQINGRFTVSGWTPIHYIHRSLEPSELLAYYRTCEIALLTPLKDGMNLVAKEYCACSIELDSVLILSEFAGAAPQLSGGAFIVNPHDIEGVADAIHHAVHLPREEKRRRMKSLRRSIRRYDVYDWVRQFLDAAVGGDLPEGAISDLELAPVQLEEKET